MTAIEANKRIDELANGLPVYLGSGDPIRKPCVVVTYKDAWSGAGTGYDVMIYPQGQGYMQPSEYHSVPVDHW